MILFTDFDETLMCTDKSVSEANMKALNELVEAGHYLVYTTGRARYGATKVVDHLGLPKKNAFLATYQGAVAYDLTTQEEIYANPMEIEGAIALVERLRGLGYHVNVCTDTYFYVFDDNDATAIFANITGERPKVIDSPEELRGEVIFKIMAVDYHDRTPLYELASQAATWDLPFEHFFSGQYYYEFCGQGQNKGQCLRLLSEKLGVPIAETVAVGDEENDVFMIREAAVGVAMCNARAEIRAEADHITEQDNNHDGVAEVIYKFILT